MAVIVTVVVVSAVVCLSVHTTCISFAFRIFDYNIILGASTFPYFPIRISILRLRFLSGSKPL